MQDPATDTQVTDTRYAPPQAAVVDVEPAGSGPGTLAGRGRRLAAVVIDSLLFAPVGLAALASDAPMDSLAFILVAIAALWLIAVAVIQLYLLNKSGQTIGKRLLKVRIVRKDGSRVSLGRLFGLRYLAPTAIGAIPVIGSVFSLADALAIFGKDRRCLHDLMADTIVIEAA